MFWHWWCNRSFSWLFLVSPQCVIVLYLCFSCQLLWEIQSRHVFLRNQVESVYMDGNHNMVFKSVKHLDKEIMHLKNIYLYLPSMHPSTAIVSMLVCCEQHLAQSTGSQSCLHGCRCFDLKKKKTFPFNSSYLNRFVQFSLKMHVPKITCVSNIGSLCSTHSPSIWLIVFTPW